VRQALAAAMKNEPLCVPGLFNKVLTAGSRYVPYKFALAISRNQSKRYRSNER